MFGICDWVKITRKKSTRTEHCLISGGQGWAGQGTLWFGLIKIGERVR